MNGFKGELKQHFGGFNIKVILARKTAMWRSPCPSEVLALRQDRGWQEGCVVIAAQTAFFCARSGAVSITNQQRAAKRQAAVPIHPAA
jgi:hypothetical protein